MRPVHPAALVLASLAVLLFNSNAVNAAFVFNMTTHQRMLQFSAAAYCPENKVWDWDCYHCQGWFNVTDTIKNPSKNTFGYAGVSPDEGIALIAFRGTQPDSIKNWITDLEVAQQMDYANVKGAAVHKGFYTAYTDVRSQVLDIARNLRTNYPDLQLYVTGHSLGAALATLCAVDLAATLGSNPIVYNYGDPRVGNDVFASYYKSQVPHTWRVVNQLDIVPHLPPKWLNYHHIATEVWYWNDKYNICNGSGEDPSCSDSQPLAASIQDHIDYMGVDMGFGPC